MPIIMTPEIMRLAMGFLIAAFHRPIADYIMHHERVLVAAFRERGIPAPMLSTESARNIYFGLGIFIVLLEMSRIWGITHPTSIWYQFVAR
jgi:hypothetical protein